MIGTTPARIAVITPYCGEPTSMLAQCHHSVLAQSVAADHWLVADGRPDPAVAGWQARHVALPEPHGDNGNTPRAVGSVLAQAGGYEFIAYLDADNWFEPGHLASLLALIEEGRVPVACAWRSFHRLDGTPMAITETEEDQLAHVDTSAYLIHRRAFALLDCWHRMPRQLSPICDRVFFRALQHQRWGFGFTRERSVGFRSRYASHYQTLGLPPPPDAKTDTTFEPCRAFVRSAAGIREMVDRLGFWLEF